MQARGLASPSRVASHRADPFFLRILTSSERARRGVGCAAAAAAATAAERERDRS